METNKIRQIFIDFFVRNGHEAVPSSSLVPGNDPTLLFTNAGMVQFKDVFLGNEHRNCPRAVTSQRCVRAGGKHNDLENVGYTECHHTFFEMLGNFSFGDYFKRDAIHHAWTLLTEEFHLPADRLWVTVFEKDDEAAAIWIKEVGIKTDRVIRIGAKDNFWQMGETGPCGPCSEIFYDHGPEIEGGPPGTTQEDGYRYVEIWNLVFMQFNRRANGTLNPLPKPSVDTGMGLERISAVLQGVHSNYEIDLFRNLINSVAEVIGVDDLHNKSLRVISDHIRSTAFLIADGVTSSNEGKGYVLRRIIRRAVRHGHQLGCKQSFLHKLVEPLIYEMGEVYPELVKNKLLLEKSLQKENDKFNETLDQGLKILDDEVVHLEDDTIPGEIVFKLYDTFGFPVDLTADVARERKMKIDLNGFNREMEQQRSRSREASQFVQRDKVKINDIPPTVFIGYKHLKTEISVLALIKGKTLVSQLNTGEEGILILEQTTFYAASGGQIGDIGKIVLSDTVFEVGNTQYLANKVIGHYGKVKIGTVSVGQVGRAEVDSSHRFNAANNHSATHLLYTALKSVLGGNVQQRGSLVESKRLRFDFSHFKLVSKSELIDIEKEVNQQIRSNIAVSVNNMDLEEAKAAGAEALFGEKYDSQVRVIKMGNYSFEVCGGTHVSHSGNIGLFKILSETGVATGIRRIEAVTGSYAHNYVLEQLEIIDSICSLLKTSTDRIWNRVSNLLKQQKEQRQTIHMLQTKLAMCGTATDSLVKTIGNVKVVVIRQDDSDVKSMRIAIDQWKQKLGSCIAVITGVRDGKITLISGVSGDLSVKYHAGKLIQTIVPLVNGRGGGKPELAQGGGNNVEGLNYIEEVVYRWVKTQEL